MSEYIERERLKEAFIADLQKLQTLDEHTMDLILIEIEEAPAADVVEVVRCKDCVWRGREECAMFYRCDCGEQHTWETDNDYCSYGARMDKEAGHESD